MSGRLIDFFFLGKIWGQVGERLLPCSENPKKLKDNDAYNKANKWFPEVRKWSVCLLKFTNVSSTFTIKSAYTNKNVKLSINTGKTTTPWTLDPEIILRVVLTTLRNGILDDILIRTIPVSILTGIMLLHNPKSLKLLWGYPIVHSLLGYHQLHIRNTRLIKWQSKLSFLWTFGQFCWSQQKPGNTICKIFTFHRGKVVYTFEFILFANLLNHLMSPSIIKMSYCSFKNFTKRFHIYPRNYIYPCNQDNQRCSCYFPYNIYSTIIFCSSLEFWCQLCKDLDLTWR